MAEKTEIAWCDSTVNPSMGCDGCELWTDTVKKCYAGIMTERYGGTSSGYPKTFADVTKFPGRMAKAEKWKDLRGVERPDKPWIPKEMPRLVFISDMGDSLSRAIDFDYLKTEIIDVVVTWPHIGLWLTKRPSRMAEFGRWLQERDCAWPKNLWAGTTITEQRKDYRIGQLLNVPAAVRFLSVEPMLGQIDFNLGHINYDWMCNGAAATKPHISWLIFGGESGPGARPCNIEWLRDGVRQCKEAGTRAFVKQDSGPRSGMQGRLSDDLFQTREFPNAI